LQLNSGHVRVEVIYCEPQRAILKTYDLDAGSSVADALSLAAQDVDFAEVDVKNAAFGIFGRLAPPEQVLQEGDRLEIYRPLTADPKTARRARARQAQTQRKP
jgi:putative ubiquitin-RnfH superfamily antitoxin RatB of RatAB toxin-antitoxin module